jgi:hypothetical protein
VIACATPLRAQDTPTTPAPSPAPQEPGPEPSKPFSKIPVDINTAGIEQTLPFDVPFYLTGTADATIKRLNLRLVERSRGSASATCAGGRVIADMPWVYRTGMSRNFQVFEPRPLQSNRMYCLNVTITRTVDAMVVTQFRKEGRARVDAALRAVQPHTAVTLVQADQLRQRLIAVVADPLTGDRLVAPAKSIFWNDPSMTQADRDAVARTFIVFLKKIKDQQDNRDNESDSILPSTGAGAITEFQKWTAPVDRFWEQLVTRVDAAAKTNPALAALVTGHLQDYRDLATLSSTALNAVANGGLPNGTSPPLLDTWDTSEIDKRVANENAMLAKLEAAAVLVKSIQGTSPAVSTAGLNLIAAEQASLTTLATAIGRTQRAVEDTRDVLIDLGKLLSKRDAAIDQAINELSDDLEQNVTLVATSVGNFATRHAWYIGADLGFAWIPGIEETTPYIGTNIYFRPVNKDAPLVGETDSFSRRASAMVGVTVASTLDKAGVRDNLFDSRMLLLGAGLRLNDSLRIAGGILVFKAPDPNPFIDNPHIKYSFFVSGSVDWDVKSTFTKMLSNKPQ